eukprot:TRINITY_DN5088_c0_g1_i20.p1 TRINITY_DN5088_c0_g1~~TRINITY_DN5088_c0_g1_i20.p1  ORF type:complete len:368 (-),score=36.42 TRINITY_DN5088_c0_g1_i20:325-1428(-)
MAAAAALAPRGDSRPAVGYDMPPDIPSHPLPRAISRDSMAFEEFVPPSVHEEEAGGQNVAMPAFPTAPAAVMMQDAARQHGASDMPEFRFPGVGASAPFEGRESPSMPMVPTLGSSPTLGSGGPTLGGGGPTLGSGGPTWGSNGPPMGSGSLGSGLAREQPSWLPSQSHPLSVEQPSSGPGANLMAGGASQPSWVPTRSQNFSGTQPSPGAGLSSAARPSWSPMQSGTMAGGPAMNETLPPPYSARFPEATPEDFSLPAFTLVRPSAAVSGSGALNSARAPGLESAMAMRSYGGSPNGSVLYKSEATLPDHLVAPRASPRSAHSGQASEGLPTWSSPPEGKVHPELIPPWEPQTQKENRLRCCCSWY